MAPDKQSKSASHNSATVPSVTSTSKLYALWVAITLTGCAAPYSPYTGNDAAKVRLTLANGAIFSSVASNVRPVVNGKCGLPVRLQQMFPYLGPTLARNVPSSMTFSPGVQTAVVYPRAGMVDSPDPMRSDAVELQMPPGKHLFLFFAGTGLANCSVGAGIELQAGRQYLLNFRFDTHAQKCLVTAKRLETTDTAEWRSYDLIAGEVCKGG